MYDYVIVGLGPTGITLGLHLLKTNHKVLFLEAGDHIGGCWNTHFTCDGYFTEHSPKVLSKSGSKEFNKLLRYLQITPKYKNVYANANTHAMDHFVEFMHSFTWKDILHFIIYFILYLLQLNDRNITLQNWCKFKHISDKAQRYLNVRSIAISNTYDKLTLNAFLQFFLKKYEYMFDLQQLQQPKEWLDASLNMLSKHSHFSIVTNRRVKQFILSDDTVAGVLTIDNTLYLAKNVICCVPLRSLFTIMHNSSFPNWFPTFHEFRDYVKRSTYTGIGFQLHYTNPRQLPHRWCWSCHDDWKVIVLDKTNFLKTLSNNSHIKQVLSCVVVDMDTKSSHIHKTANECASIEEIVHEAFRQMNALSSNLFTNPQKITLSNNLFYSNDFGWASLDSSYSPSSAGKGLSYQGQLKNLFSVGPHNFEEVVLIETAIKSAKKFSEEVLHIKNVF